MPHGWGSITYRESSPDSPTLSVRADGGSRVARKVYVPWNQLADAAREFVGYSEVKVSPGGQKYVSRNTPIPFNGPVRGFQGLFYCEAAGEIEGVKPAPQGVGSGYDPAMPTREAVFEEALMSLQFSSPNHEVMTDLELLAYQADNGHQTDYPDESLLLRYVWAQYQPTGFFQTLPPFAALRWEDTGKPMSAAAAVLLTRGDLTVEWRQVPLEAFPLTAINSTVGKTNASPFGVPGSQTGIIPAGKLVCCFPRVRAYRMVNARFALDIVYSFKLYPNGANKFYRWNKKAGAGGWEAGWFAASHGGTPNEEDRIFRDADYSALFKPEP